MKIAILILSVVIVLGVGGWLMMRQSGGEVKAVADGALIWDVRTPQEYATSRVAAAQNVPVQDLEAGKVPAVDKSAPIYVYCRSGNRSSVATKLLRQAGFTNVTDMGGLGDVSKYGLTLSN